MVTARRRKDSSTVILRADGENAGNSFFFDITHLILSHIAPQRLRTHGWAHFLPYFLTTPSGYREGNRRPDNVVLLKKLQHNGYFIILK